MVQILQEKKKKTIVHRHWHFSLLAIYTSSLYKGDRGREGEGDDWWFAETSLQQWLKMLACFALLQVGKKLMADVENFNQLQISHASREA